MHYAQELRPNLAIIVRTRDDSELERLMQAGASEVVPEIFEGSLMLGSHGFAEAPVRWRAHGTRGFICFVVAAIDVLSGGPLDTTRAHALLERVSCCRTRSADAEARLPSLG